MYKDIFESIRNEAKKRNLRERTIQCIALMSVTSFVRLEKMFLILHLKMRKVFLLIHDDKILLLQIACTAIHRLNINRQSMILTDADK